MFVPAVSPKRDSQLELHFSSPRAAVAGEGAPRAVGELAGRLSRLLSEPIRVEVTDNAWTMVSFRRRESEGLTYRVHHMFLEADEPTVEALAAFSGRQRRRAGRALDRYIKANRDRIRQREPRPDPPLEPKGSVHDLQSTFDKLNALHFDDRIVARIGWGRRAPRRSRHTIKMGVYFHDTKTIRLHPALDQAFVPDYFVELIVFHEMLHQVFPPDELREDGGPRCIHSKEFRAREETFPDYERARTWEHDHLNLLLRSR